MRADKLNYGRRARKMYVNDENLKKLEDKSNSQDKRST